MIPSCQASREAEILALSCGDNFSRYDMARQCCASSRLKGLLPGPDHLVRCMHARLRCCQGFAAWCIPLACSRGLVVGERMFEPCCLGLVPWHFCCRPTARACCLVHTLVFCAWHMLWSLSTALLLTGCHRCMWSSPHICSHVRWIASLRAVTAAV